MKSYLKTLLHGIFCACLACTTACFNDDFLDTIKNENDDLYYYVNEPDIGLRSSFNISDTGSTENLITGDDGYYQHTPSAMRFAIYNNYSGSDDIVRDDVTGLMWTRCSAMESDMDTSDDCSGSKGTLTWSEADAFCDGLEYAGYTDWRLPSASELFSIINFNEINPAIDPTVFPNTAVGKYWTSTPLFFFAIHQWYVNFDSTQLDLLNCANIDQSPDPENYVRCVCTEK